MCNRYRNRGSPDEWREEFSQTRIPLKWAEIPNLRPGDISITDMGPIVRSGEEGPELVQRRWSWSDPRGKPVYNFRSEGRDFTSGRCLILTDGFYEYTTPADPKQKKKDKWLFTKTDEERFCIAGIWRDTDQGEAFTMLTTEPGPDVAPFHHRQIAVLDRKDWSPWLDHSVSAKDILKVLPAGTLQVEQSVD